MCFYKILPPFSGKLLQSVSAYCCNNDRSSDHNGNDRYAGNGHSNNYYNCGDSHNNNASSVVSRAASKEDNSHNTMVNTIQRTKAYK